MFDLTQKKQKEIKKSFKESVQSPSKFGGDAMYLSTAQTRSCCGAYELAGLANLNLEIGEMAYWLLLYRKLCRETRHSLVFVTVPVYTGGEHVALRYDSIRKSFDLLKIKPVAYYSNHVHHGHDSIALYILHGNVSARKKIPAPRREEE